VEEAEDGRSGEVPRRRLTPRRADEQPQARLVAARELVRDSGVPGCCLVRVAAAGGQRVSGAQVDEAARPARPPRLCGVRLARAKRVGVHKVVQRPVQPRAHVDVDGVVGGDACAAGREERLEVGAERVLSEHALVRVHKARVCLVRVAESPHAGAGHGVEDARRALVLPAVRREGEHAEVADDPRGRPVEERRAAALLQPKRDGALAALFGTGD